MELLDDDDDDDKWNKFLVIFNSSFDAELITRFELEIFPKIVDILGKNKTIDEKFKLNLAFVNDDRFRERYLYVEDRLSANDLISRRRIFALAIIENKHFIEMMINNWDDITGGILSNEALRESLLLVQLLNIDEFNDHKKYLQQINQLSIATTNNCFKSNLSNELQRILNLEELFMSHIPNIRLTSLASKFNVIDILNEHVNLSKIDSQLVHSILTENRKYNHRFTLCNVDMVQQLTEQELYNNFLIVKLLLEVIMDNQHVNVLNELSVEKLKEVKMLFKNIDSFSTYISILEISYSLIFIRWDHFTSNEESADLDRTIESGSESTKSRKCSKRSEKSAFICSVAALDNILNLLKSLALQKLHSDEFRNENDLIKNSFLPLYEYINDAHWRFTLFYTNATTGPTRSTSFVNGDIKKYFTKHPPHRRENSNVSSDEEIKSQQEVSRRKPRRRNPFRKSIDDKTLVISNSTEHEQRSDTLHRSVSTSERRCPVSRMLGSPEHLATVCLNNSDFEATKRIVKVRSAFLIFFFNYAAVWRVIRRSWSGKG